MLERVRAFLTRHPPGPRLAVGYSGGLDSTVLLHLLARLREECGLDLRAIHVHHGLSPRADQWAEHCRAVCLALAVPLQVERVRVEAAGEGLEAAARHARYAVYARLDVDAIALAHHRDDQAETLLLQLLRGAGLKGLAAMPEVRDLAGKRLLRPLLDCSRGELEGYARTQGLAWIEDESNFDTSHSRNALRHRVMPLLAGIFPGATRTLAEAAQGFAESAALLDDLARIDASVAQASPPASRPATGMVFWTDPAPLADGDARANPSAPLARVADLTALPPERARNLLRHLLERHGVAARRQRLREALRQLATAAVDAQPRIDFGSVSLRRYRGWVYLVEQRPDADWRFAWSGEAELDLGPGGRLHFRAVTGEGVRLRGEVLVVRRRGGETLRLQPGGPARPLKDWLREAGLPPWQRAHLPVLLVDGQPAWGAGLGADVAHRAGPGEAGWLISWRW